MSYKPDSRGAPLQNEQNKLDSFEPIMSKMQIISALVQTGDKLKEQKKKQWLCYTVVAFYRYDASPLVLLEQRITRNQHKVLLTDRLCPITFLLMGVVSAPTHRAQWFTEWFCEYEND